jgi:hypothetical protein
MNGLLIEDDPAKALKVLDWISEFFPLYEMEHRLSYKTGLDAIFNNTYDFILLDMSLPTYDQGDGSFSGKPKGFGGRDIMKEMKRHKKISKVKVFTQYNDFDGGSISMAELDEQLKEKYSAIYQGYISYNSKQTDWQVELLEFLEQLSI